MIHTATAKPTLFKSEALLGWMTGVFMRCGVPEADAAIAASVLVRTNLRGIDTHGISRLAGYVDKLQSGEVNANARPTSEWRDGALHFDGDGGLGQVVATAAVAEAVRRARETAVVPCFLRQSGHLAALGMFALQAAESGMVAMLCQETPPLMALAGSKSPSIGNNPIAFAMPVSGRPPLVFDMAASVVARGSVLQAVRDKEELPDGWAIDAEGLPTNDPQAALKGSMLPVGGHKGIGLAMLVQCLAGSLTASSTAASASKFGAMSSAGNVSAFILMINPEKTVGQDRFADHAGAWLSHYAQASGPESRYPGERADASERGRSIKGIPLSDSILRELHGVGEKVGLPFDLAGV